MEFEIKYKAQTGDEEPNKEKVNIPKFVSGKVAQQIRRIYQNHSETKVYYSEADKSKKTEIKISNELDMLIEMGTVIAREVLSPKQIKVDDVDDNTLMELGNIYLETTILGVSETKKKD